ncbi:hypothetical protein K438DRAFT_1476124, partial [Mycena galopus ATCC 62051]
PFGGMNMCFAGDFAQLPPVASLPLFSGSLKVALVLGAGMKIYDQENTIGKIIWQMVDTVLILKQNMRQTNMSANDIKFRLALSNMRLVIVGLGLLCEPQDLDFMHSRQISNRAGQPTFDDPRFQGVSLITAWNSQKDKVNDLGCVKFATETGQELTHFYAEDTLADNTGKNERKARGDRAKNVVPPKKALTERQKHELWEAPACASDNIPGKLSLCVGMPVMIRNNDATELCITKGQEATVL